MKKKLLRKILPLTLSTSFLWNGLPAVNSILPTDFMEPNIVQAAGISPKTWDFSHSIGLWNYSGKWDYNGTPTLEYAKTAGGSAKLSIDYSEQSGKSWSEVKLKTNDISSSTPFILNGYNVFSYDLYFNPQAMTEGTFKTKLYMKSDAGKEIVNKYVDINMAAAKSVPGTDLKKITVHIPFAMADAKITYMEMSIVGCNTSYKGDLFLKNISFSHEKIKDGYVNKTAIVRPQSKVEFAQLDIPAKVNLADGRADKRAAQLYAYLKGIATSDKVLYGHQNDMHKKAGRGPSDSDTYDIVNDYPAVVGIDGLALTGSELSLTDAEKAAGLTLMDKAVAISIKANQKGAVITLSCHMPNFAEVAKKGKINGKYDYSGYSPNVTTGDVVSRILPGGDLNSVYNGYLDMIAQYGSRLQNADIPVLFRPFHECNGSWFWWGAAFCSPSQYKNLFRYTEEYLRDKKGLHNFLYVYSPGGPITSEADYMTRYPGDAFVDITAFDMYHKDPLKKDNWMNSLDATMNVVRQFAKNHNKVPAVSEVGILVGNSAMAKTGNKRLDWFDEVLKNISQSGMAYFMTWSNFDETNFDQPYMVGPKRGHEMVNQFVDFYNKPQSIFASQMPDYRTLKIEEQPAQSIYGYITTPNSYERICKPEILKAHISGNVNKVSFVYKKADGSVIDTVQAVKTTDGIYNADITKSELSKIGRTMGSIQLLVNSKPVDSVKVLFNIPKPPIDISLVDNFESYYGDNGLLQAAYSTNSGPGSSVRPALADAAVQHKNGNAGLAFNYKIAKGSYAGIIKNMKGVDWSNYNAVQFWIAPDGKGQNFIIQINTNGEDFEVSLSALTKTTKPTLVTIPFSQFKGKQNGQFDKTNIQHFAIYCNSLGDSPVESTMYFDDIRAVK
ncbi:glycosyl hydrolase [Pectinatus sottacetonis]|uniref:glycosyl hydrolase n=1 Tax=Pectinatus sottacetonis TaxID=1002795 RepID=UPI0018C52534|nr:glycosyl hydrolase [Pectinatus sottacetonis]